MKPSKKSGLRRSEKQIRSLLLLGQNYPGTIARFCKTHNIHKGSFYYWRNKYGTPATDAAPAFVPLQISNHPQGISLFAEIELSPAVTVRLFQEVEASWFKTLL
jgi:transposase-like protein